MTSRSATKFFVDESTNGEVQVWYFRLDLDSEDYAQCARTLDDEERHRAQRFRFETHRRRFVAGRGTLRMILGYYAACDPQRVRLQYSEHGKPYLTSPASVGELKLSVSNSDGLGAVAVALRTELGLDLERIRADRDHVLIASREFAVDEREWLLGLPDDERTAAFFDLWTCKEAYLKGRGLGLSGPLNHFSISLRPDLPPRLAWSEIDDMDPQRWHLHRLAIAPGFAACLAVAGDCRAVRAAPWQLPA